MIIQQEFWIIIGGIIHESSLTFEDSPYETPKCFKIQIKYLNTMSHFTWSTQNFCLVKVIGNSFLCLLYLIPNAAQHFSKLNRVQCVAICELICLPLVHCVAIQPVGTSVVKTCKRALQHQTREPWGMIFIYCLCNKITGQGKQKEQRRKKHKKGHWGASPNIRGYV